MVEYLGFLYGIIKDLKEYFTYTKSEKKIDENYVTHLKQEHNNKGEKLEFHWSKEEKIESRRLRGWEFYYQIDVTNKKKYLLKNKSGQILLAKKIQ